MVIVDELTRRQVNKEPPLTPPKEGDWLAELTARELVNL
nr:MAG TPA: Nuclear pore complex component [Caudoviricetes sp.]